MRTMTGDDADFIFDLLNSPGWLEYIGDRGISSLDQARDYLTSKVIPDYENSGFGFYVVERLGDETRVGNCGLIHRPGLEHVDLGYSLITAYEGRGYAFEAAKALMEYGFEVIGLQIIQAITTEANMRSQNLLNKLGMSFQKMINLPDDDEELMLFSINAPRKGSSK